MTFPDAIRKYNIIHVYLINIRNLILSGLFFIDLAHPTSINLSKGEFPATAPPSPDRISRTAGGYRGTSRPLPSRIMTTRVQMIAATCTATYLYSAGPGIARSRAQSVPLFNPINNRRYLTPRFFMLLLYAATRVYACV